MSEDFLRFGVAGRLSGIAGIIVIIKLSYRFGVHFYYRYSKEPYGTMLVSVHELITNWFRGTLEDLLLVISGV